MIGAELADELSTIADAYCADTREAWRMARFVNANMVAILAALRSERPASGERAVERWFDIGFAAARELSDLDGSAQKDDRYPAWRGTKIRAALAAAQEG